MRRTIVALLLLMSGATAAAAQSTAAKRNLPEQEDVKQAPRSGNCGVGVISYVGEFNVKTVGFTRFSWKSSQVPIESWHIDDLVVAKVSSVLGKRTTVRHIPFRKEAALSLIRDHSVRIGPIPIFNTLKDAELVRAMAAGTRCARYVAVGRADTEYGTYDLKLRGLGIIAGMKPFFTGDLYNLYALIRVWVYDGQTLAQVKSRIASAGYSFGDMIHGPHREVDKTFWPDPPNTAAQNAKLRDAVRQLIAQSLDATLPDLLLTQ